ncbi:ABC transporter permease [Fimbriiglobus ruber]|uniref:Transport permease protein n=1 Tax=Fimbriiglobus ruber TaxID=1908690 RepID=A0A225E4Q3_9BACT|nr:ABC transporter permease [Fimbriiglobus ruber]OWK44469.1 polysaccharide ABC transporter permease [Fimbriiglobus ruber]
MLQHLKAVWLFRHFWLSLVKMDLRSRYRRSVLGIGWSVMHPVLMSVVLVVGFGHVMMANKYLEYGAYLLCGLCVWDFIRGSVVGGCTSLISNEAYIRQCPLPYGIYTLRTVLGTGVHFLITLTVVVVLTAFLTGTANSFLGLRFVLPTLPFVFLFCWGAATVMAFITPYFHDMKHLIEVAAQFFFFVTPIMLPFKGLPPWLQEFEQYNPVHIYLELIRAPLLSGEAPSLALYGQGITLGVVVAGLGACMIAWLQKKIIFEL